MNWREPWGESTAYQTLTFALAACLGMLFVAPWWMACGARWDSVAALESQILAQQQMAASLRSQTAQLQRSMPTTELASVDAQTLIDLASSNALQFSRSSQDAQTLTPHLNVMHLQLLPMRFELQGPWAGWLSWLEQWSTAAPGVTLSSLTLKANPHGGLTVHMLAVAVQRIGQDISKISAPVDVASKQMVSDPFDAQRWADAKKHHAQKHPSYVQQVAPELLRVQEPLERFAREHLQYVGQISAGSEVEALIRVLDPAGSKFGEVHRVRVGAHAGQSFGRVSVIGPEHLMLDELLLARNGEWMRQAVRMPLQERLP